MISRIIIIYLLLYLSLNSIEAKWYVRTANLSVSKWNTFKTSQTIGKFHSLIECGSICEENENCNAFKFDKTILSCSLAMLTQLEDGQPNIESETFHIDYETANNLPMDCYGSEHCCRPENQCNLNEGDCNTDEDCIGLHLSLIHI